MSWYKELLPTTCSISDYIKKYFKREVKFEVVAQFEVCDEIMRESRYSIGDRSLVEASEFIPISDNPADFIELVREGYLSIEEIISYKGYKVEYRLIARDNRSRKLSIYGDIVVDLVEEYLEI
ncbi:MAG: hypothetical protein QXJ68_03785 [Methanocellales archaeon]